ncbi:MAG: hypothetical protein ACTSQE_14375 [Candidatus Heimdallarchaeaceae archaeon]
MNNYKSEKIESNEREYAVALMRKLEEVSNKINKGTDTNVNIDLTSLAEVIKEVVMSSYQEKDPNMLEVDRELLKNIKGLDGEPGRPGKDGDTPKIDYKKIVSMVVIPKYKVDYDKIVSMIDLPNLDKIKTLSENDVVNIIIKKLKSLSDENLKKYTEDDDFINAIIRRLPHKKAYSTATGAKILSDLEDVDITNIGKDENGKYKFGDNLGYVGFDMESTVNAVKGQIKWDADHETIVIGIDGNSIPVNFPSDLFENQTGVTIPAGTPIYASGAIGASGKVSGAPFIADKSIPQIYYLGITWGDTITGDSGIYITGSARLRGLDTSIYPDGTPLYISETVAGGFQSTEPTSGYILPVAFILTSHVNNGVLSVRWTQDSEGGDVSKVGTPVDNQVAIWTGDGTIEGTSDFVFDGTNVGIGTDSPTSPLNIKTTGTGENGGIKIEASDDGNEILSIGQHNTAGTGYIRMTKNGVSSTAIVLDAGGDSWFNTGGKLGIGTDSPSSILHLNDTSALLTLSSATNNDASILFEENNVATFKVGFDASQDVFKIVNTNFNGAGIAIDTSGKVGIGTDNPSEELHIEATNPKILLASSSDSAYQAGLQASWDAGHQMSLTGQSGSEILGQYAGNTALPYGNVGIGTTTPNSTLGVNGSISLPYTAKTGAYTLTASDYTVDCTSSTFTITLPTASGISGRIYNIKNSGTGIITIDANGTETIDGNLTAEIIKPTSLTVQSTGVGWIII